MSTTSLNDFLNINPRSPWAHGAATLATLQTWQAVIAAGTATLAAHQEDPQAADFLYQIAQTYTLELQQQFPKWQVVCRPQEYCPATPIRAAGVIPVRIITRHQNRHSVVVIYFHLDARLLINLRRDKRPHQNFHVELADQHCFEIIEQFMSRYN